MPHFLRVTQLHPTEPNVHAYLGAAYNQLTHYKQAVEALTQALRLNHNSFGTYFNLGVALGHLGGLPLAKTALREALVIQPNSADAHFQLASVYLQLNAAGLAATHFQKALAIRPDFPKAQAGLTRAMMLSAAGSGVYLNPLEQIAPAHAHKSNGPAIADAHPKSNKLDPDAVRLLSNEIMRAANELLQQLENTVVPLLNGMRRLVIEGKGHFPDFLQHHTDFRATCLRIAEARKKIRRLTLKILTAEELQTS